MQEVIILLVTVSILDVWINDIVFPICYGVIKPNKAQRIFKLLFSRKPFNCDLCMSVWIGIILSVLCMNIVFLLLPLLTKFKSRLL